MGTKTLELVSIADTAIIDPTAQIGKNTKVWAFVQIAEHAVIGENCVIGNGVYIDRFVKIGNRVRIHNKALLYRGVIIEDDVFIGPAACFTNDESPRSSKTRNLKGKSWRVGKGASIGANATILPDVNIGEYAMIGAGSVVTRSVPNHKAVCGNPARPMGIACYCGNIIKEKSPKKKSLRCESCGKSITLSEDAERVKK